MRADPTRRPRPIHALCFTLALSAGLAVSSMSVGQEGAVSQERGNPVGEWRYQSADAWGTRYSPVDQINGGNFEELEIAWIFRGDNFSPEPQTTSRSTPSYIDGMLYTVAGSRRTVVAMDPATGEIIWTYREPSTQRWERSMRASYGKGVGYAEVDGNGVIYITTPGFFLHALDARSGQPLENWGKAVPVEGFSETVRFRSRQRSGCSRPLGRNPAWRAQCSGGSTARTSSTTRLRTCANSGTKVRLSPTVLTRPSVLRPRFD